MVPSKLPPPTAPLTTAPPGFEPQLPANVNIHPSNSPQALVIAKQVLISESIPSSVITKNHTQVSGDDDDDEEEEDEGEIYDWTMETQNSVESVPKVVKQPLATQVMQCNL